MDDESGCVDAPLLRGDGGVSRVSEEGGMVDGCGRCVAVVAESRRKVRQAGRQDGWRFLIMRG